jgi:peptide/nickel transport system substrate-binding protein
MSYHKSLVAAALLLAMPLALAATPAVSQTVLRIDESPVGEIDPAKGTDYADTMLAVNVYDALILPAQGGPGVAPHVATGWEQDGNVYTFSLRDDITFHSGNRLTARDVVFSYERMMALGQGFSNLFVGRVDSVEAVDDTTVRFTLSGPFAPFLPSLVRLPIVDSELVLANIQDGSFGELGDYGQAFLSAGDAGSGAYTVVSQDPQNETVLERFDGYFLGVPEAAPDQVRLRYGIEASTVRALMSRGEHEITSQWIPPEVIRALAAEDGIGLLTERGTTVFMMKLNTQKPPLDDVHCRLALTYAYDYATTLQMVSITEDVIQGTPINGPVPAGMLGADHDTPPFTQDLDRARAEFAQCAGATAAPIEIAWNSDVPAQERLALLMQSSFEALGFKTSITRLTWAAFIDRATNPETSPHIFQVFVNATTPDPDSLLYNMYHSSAGGTWMSSEHLVDARVDELLEAGRTELDEDARAKIYRELAAYLREIAPSIWAYEYQAVFAAREVVNAPTLSQDDQRYALEGGFNMVFRQMEISE